MLRAFCEKNKVESEFEKTNTLPKSFVDYQANLYDSLFTKSSLKSTKGGINVLFKDYEGGGSMLMPAQIPFMGAGWDNIVSRIDIVDIASIIHLYDRTFYRNKLETIVGFSGRYNLTGSNDRMSSGMAF